MAEETVIITRKEYDKFCAQKAELDKLNQWVQTLSEQLILANKHRFGMSSEKTKVYNDDSQPSLFFNEAEQTADEAIKSLPTKEVKVKEHLRKQRVIDPDHLPENIEVEEIVNDIPEEERKCDECGGELEEIGTDVKYAIALIPAKWIIRKTITHAYRCPDCKKRTGLAHIIRAREAPSVIPGGEATAEAISYIAVEKYVKAVPLYRLEQQLNAGGLPLSRQTMSNWLIKASELYFKPMVQRMREMLIQEEILHADETRLQVLHEPERKAETDSFIWLYRTGRDVSQQLVIYDYQETRASQHPKDFLSGFKGYLHTDGYAGYHKLSPDIRVVGCMAHARRKFIEALEVVKKENRSASTAARAVEYFDKLFRLEEEFSGLVPDERKDRRKELSEPIITEMKSWISRLNAGPKTTLGKAVHYFLEQYPWLCAYLEDGRLEISNNLAERSIKPFVIGRKNFLFCNTPSGADSSAAIYSIIETAKENGLDPYRYLTWVLQTAPALNMKAPEQVDSLLPMNAPTECRSHAG